MNFDHVARVYRVLEHAVFGGCLQRARVRWLGELPNRRRALVLGEGDGRFLVGLTKAQPLLEIDCVEASEEMIRQARRRLTATSSGEGRVRFLCEDIMRWNPEATYDLVVTHFFLDCFEEKELRVIIEKIAGAFETDGIWLLADFAIPAGGWSRWLAGMLVAVMYFFFRVVAGLKTNRLVDPGPILLANDFQCLKRESSLGGLLKSEEWTRRSVSG